MSETKKKHLSATQLGMIEKCGVQYQFRYLDKVVAKPPGASLHVGRGVHHAVEQDLREKIADAVLLPDEEIAELARAGTLASIEESGLSLEKHDSIAAEKGAAVDKAVRLAELHHVELAPALNPVHVERKFRVELQGYPYDLVGVIDVEEEHEWTDGDAGGTVSVVRDTKTAAKSPNKNAADVSEQLTMYAAGKLAVDGALPAKLVLDHLVDNKTPVIRTLETTRDMEDVQMLLRRVERAAEVIESGAFMPANPATDWYCSQKWCGYFDQCPFARAPKSVSMGGESKT